MPSGSDLPRLVNHLTTAWHRRHPRLGVFSQILVSVWVIVLGLLLCSIGDGAGSLLFVAAGLPMWCVYVFQRSLEANPDL
jgi:hypothetical protein